MAKKSICGLLCLLLFFTAPLLAQEKEPEVNKSYQTFRWSPSEKASRYSVEIEKLSGNSWKKYLSHRTTQTFAELLMEPGKYRVSILTYNIIGRKSSSSKWLSFAILDESAPYFENDSFIKNENTNFPTIFVNQTDEHIKNSGVFIKAEENQPQNSFFVRGRNIFFPETEFSMVPVDIESKYFETVKNRSEIPLTILDRDTMRGGVTLSYEENKLSNGRYRITARNPENKTAWLDCVVIVKTPSAITGLDNLISDSNFGIFVKKIIKNPDNPFYPVKVEGRGFYETTEFFLDPVSKGGNYPFISALAPSRIALGSSKISLDNAGKNLAQVKADSRGIYSGYYNVKAKNGDKEVPYKILIETDCPDSYKPVVSSVKIKEKKGKATILISGTNFTDQLTGLLVGTVEKDGTNRRIVLGQASPSSKGTEIEFTAKASDLRRGTYALILESERQYSRIYVRYGKDENLEIFTPDSEELTDLFFIYKSKNEEPVELKLPVTEDSRSPGFYIEYENILHYKTPVFLPAVHFSGSYNKFYMDNFEGVHSDIRVEADLLHFDWITVTGEARYNPHFNSKDFAGVKDLGFGGGLRLNIPVKILNPFISAGFVYNLENDLFALQEDNLFTHLNIPFSAGFCLFNFLDAKAIVTLKNNGSKVYLESSYAAGFKIKLRKPVRAKTDKKKTVLTIVMPGYFGMNTIITRYDLYSFIHDETGKFNIENLIPVRDDGSSKKYFRYMDVVNKINPEKIVFAEGITAISGFSKVNAETISLPSSCMYLGKYMFADAFYGQKVLLNWSASDSVADRGIAVLLSGNSSLNATETVSYAHLEWNDGWYFQAPHGYKRIKNKGAK